MKTILSFLVLLTIATSTLAQSTLFYTSSPTSYVGQGGTGLYSTYNGDRFIVDPPPDHGLHLFIRDAEDSWNLNIAAPNNDFLEVGEYYGATSFIFGVPGTPGLDFYGHGRISSDSSGIFQVYQIIYDTDSRPSSVAVDFVQYELNMPENWVFGSIRFNSDYPLTTTIPEPSTLCLGLLGALLFLGRRKT